MQIIRPIAALCIGLAVSCAELGKEDCEQGDWLSIGQRDGSRGRSADVIARHAETCADHGFAVDAAAWEQGRQQGLQVFCTPQSQYQAGRDGRPFNAICAQENLPQHRDAYEKGRQYYTLTRRIEMLQSEIRDLRRGAQADPGKASAGLQLEAFMLRMQIDILLRERRAYESL